VAADVLYEIISTLPKEWRASIKAAHREGLETDARAEQLLNLILSHLATSGASVE
jgi:hypothetical protein